MKILFLNRFTGAVSCEIEIGEDVRAALRIKVALEKAVKERANLVRANLSHANLSGADLSGANLIGANLIGANLPPFSHCPEEGSFIAWKKLRYQCVAKLEIPAKAKRACSYIGRKMRAEYVKVLAIWNSDGEPIKSGTGQYSASTIYCVGEITRPDSFNDDPRVECTNGIHFFITRKEAKDY